MTYLGDSQWRALREQLAEFYRDLHAHPELSGHEHRTALRVAGALGDAGIEVTENIGGTGVSASSGAVTARS